MIVLDTNVVSEPFKPRPNVGVMDWLDKVVDWLDKQDKSQLFLAAISYAELIVGVAWLPEGRRKNELSARSENFIDACFEDRMLSFDRDAAIAAATLINRARASGYNIAEADGQIAAIAFAKGFSVATRDTRPFAAAGLAVIDPWLASR